MYFATWVLTHQIGLSSGASGWPGWQLPFFFQSQEGEAQVSDELVLSSTGFNQSVNILFNVCSQWGDIRPPQKRHIKKHILLYYNNLPTGLWIISLTEVLTFLWNRFDAGPSKTAIAVGSTEKCLLFFSSAAAPSSSEGQKKGDSLMFIIIGCLVAVTMVVAFIGGLCYISRTHHQIYSKLPSEFPEWLTDWMKIHIIVCSCSVGCGYISRTHKQICSKLPSEFHEWMNENSYSVCSWGVGCGYIGRTHQQIYSKLPSEFPDWLTDWIKIHVLAVLVVVISLAHVSRSPNCTVSFLTDWMKIHILCVLAVLVVVISVAHISRSAPNCPVSFMNEWMKIHILYIHTKLCMFMWYWLWLHQSHTPAGLLETSQWVRCDVCCGYISRTHHQMCSKLSREFGVVTSNAHTRRYV